MTRARLTARLPHGVDPAEALGTLAQTLYAGRGVRFAGSGMPSHAHGPPIWIFDASMENSRDPQTCPRRNRRRLAIIAYHPAHHPCRDRRDPRSVGRRGDFDQLLNLDWIPLWHAVR